MLLGGEFDGEKPYLAAETVFPCALAAFDRRVNRGEQPRARAFQIVHGAGLDEALDHALVDGSEIHLFAELVDGAESADLLASNSDRFDGGGAYVLDRAQAEADRGAVRGEAPVA